MTMETYRIDKELTGYQSPHIGRGHHHQIMTVFHDILGVKQQMAKYNPMALILQDPAKYKQEVKPLIEEHQRLLKELQTLYPHKDICNRYSYNHYLHFERKYGISPKTKLEGLEFYGYHQRLARTTSPEPQFHFAGTKIDPFGTFDANIYEVHWDKWYNSMAPVFLMAYVKPIDTLFYNTRAINP